MTARLVWLLLASLLVLADSAPVPAASAEALLETAATAWAAGRFADAGTALADAYQAGAQNVPVCLAAADAWRRTGDRGRFVLWLVRGHELDPSDAAARKALDAAGVGRDGPRLLLGQHLSPGRLVRLAVLANTVWWCALALLRWRRSRPPVRALVATGLLVGWLWLEAGLALSRETLWPRGVVLAETAARCAPEGGAEILFTLPAGQVVTRGPDRNGFRRVTAPGDRVGWLPDTAVAVADP